MFLCTCEYGKWQGVSLVVRSQEAHFGMNQTEQSEKYCGVLSFIDLVQTPTIYLNCNNNTGGSDWLNNGMQLQENV